MNLFGLTLSWQRKAATLTLDQLIQRLDAVMQTVSGITVTPDTAMEAPTVQAIVQAVAGTLSTLPVHVMQKTVSDTATKKELLPNHPVAKLLAHPNDEQDRVTYWLDAASWLVRHGNHYAVKGRGQTGPIRRLEAVPPGDMAVTQREDRSVVYRVSQASGGQRDYERWEMHHVRLGARNGYCGNSPIHDVRESIALEIAAERFGASFFGNGAMPSLVFKYAKESQGHQTQEQRDKFIQQFHAAYGAKGRFRALVLPKGMEMDPLAVDNDKAQFLETRKHQRTVIAGAFGIPPHLVGDLERGTFSNIEHQSLEFIQRVILRYVRIFEAAMERDLLTPADRAQGVIIRFNLDGALRGDFKSRQEGLKIQREMGVITANEWREEEGRNPMDGLDTVWEQGPSGQNQNAKNPSGDEGGDDATGAA